MVGAWRGMSQRLVLDVEWYQKPARIDLTHLNAPVLGPRDRASGLRIRNIGPHRRQSALLVGIGIAWRAYDPGREGRLCAYMLLRKNGSCIGRRSFSASGWDGQLRGRRHRNTISANEKERPGAKVPRRP
jgi:hypothetical protein